MAELPKEWKEGPDGPEEIKLNKRQILKEYWARWGKWYKYQPLDHIRFVPLCGIDLICVIDILKQPKFREVLGVFCSLFCCK